MEAKTAAGGTIFPEMAKKKPQKGTVLTVGPGRLDDHGERFEMELKEGDVVLYASHNSTEIQIDDRKLLSSGKARFWRMLNSRRISDG